MKFLSIAVIFILVYSFWFLFFKSKMEEIKKRPNFDLKYWLKSDTRSKEKNETVQEIEILENGDIRMFDEVAKLLFEKRIKNNSLESAHQIQNEFLNKMPPQASSQINHFDLEEWSIYWSYRGQSLEYYASRYGIFYTHVDAQGVEHKMELKNMLA